MASWSRKLAITTVCGVSATFYARKVNASHKREDNLSWATRLRAASTEHFDPGAGPSWDSNWDKRAHLSDPDTNKSERTLKHFIFVRHGEYNIKGYDDQEKYLTQRGIEQAEMTGERLANMKLNYTKIVQSNMTRAQETCNIISKHLPGVPVRTTEMLREGPPIAPDPPKRPNEPEIKYFAEAPRIESAFRKFIYRPGSSDKDEPVEVFVCHANVIRYFLCRVAQFPPQGWLRMSLKHGSITWVTIYSDGDVWIRCIGDSGYIPTSKLTS